MKKILMSLILLVSFFFIQSCHKTMPSFEVSAKGTKLLIRTTNPFYYYPYAGLRITTPGVAINFTKKACFPMENGFCLFDVSKAMPVLIRLKGKPRQLCLILCLNGDSPACCQNYSVELHPENPNVICRARLLPPSCRGPRCMVMK
ncbi:MAG: hypothetical protein H0U70_12755 [Tatlockia sp.]|nr:hypothetical protein [Tatlockia sp.]